MLPNELKAYRRRRICARLIPCLVVVLFLAVVLVLWGTVMFDIKHKVVRASVYTLVLLIPFLLFGVPHRMIDRTWSGTVQRVRIETTPDNESSAKPTLEHLYMKNTVYLDVALPNGKTVCKRVYSGNARLQQHLDTYQEGDRVFHLYGSHRVIVLPKPNDTAVCCAVCGSSNPTKEARCRSCGHTLIKAFE